MSMFADNLELRGFSVNHVKLPEETSDTISLLREHIPPDTQSLHVCDPCDDVLSRRLQRFADANNLDLVTHASPMFLTPND